MTVPLLRPAACQSLAAGLWWLPAPLEQVWSFDLSVIHNNRYGVWICNTWRRPLT